MPERESKFKVAQSRSASNIKLVNKMKGWRLISVVQGPKKNGFFIYYYWFENAEK